MHLPVPATNVAFTVFGVDIMWYAICLTSGIILGGILGYSRTDRYDFPKEKYLDVLIYSVPASVIGARLFYVAFEWKYYSQHLSQIFHFRGGGLAIHGALIGGLLVGYLFLRKNNISWIKTFDMVAPCLALGQAIGRWGNYFNQEAHGTATDLPWGIWIEAEQQYVHPTFLYESLWCFLLVLFLCLVVTKRQKFDGQVFLTYVILYCIERFFVEGLRTDSLMLGSLRQAQVFSIVAVIVCGILYYIGSKTQYHACAPVNASECAPAGGSECVPADSSANGSECVPANAPECTPASDSERSENEINAAAKVNEASEAGETAEANKAE